MCAWLLSVLISLSIFWCLCKCVNTCLCWSFLYTLCWQICHAKGETIRYWQLVFYFYIMIHQLTHGLVAAESSALSLLSLSFSFRLFPLFVLAGLRDVIVLSECGRLCYFIPSTQIVFRLESFVFTQCLVLMAPFIRIFTFLWLCNPTEIYSPRWPRAVCS